MAEGLVSAARTETTAARTMRADFRSENSEFMEDH